MNEDVSGLSHTVAAVCCLDLKGWVPVDVQHEHMVGRGQVETHTTSLQGQQHHL